MTTNIFLTSRFHKKVTCSFLNIIRKMGSQETDVIIESKQDKGVITLNRPKALNALNLSMIKKIHPVLEKWEKEKTLVIIKGSGGRAFCSGGDIKAVVEAGLRGGNLGYEFFKQEYAMNGLIGAYKIPYIAFIDGIVMGGGVGLSVHGKYRVATERTMFAMPETLIGLFPDVGTSYVLPRLTGKLGTYLALTGQRLLGSDVLKAGIATHFCESKNLEPLEEALLRCNNEEDIKNTLLTFKKKDKSEFSLSPVMEKINHCFSGKTMEEIFGRLKTDGSKWADDTLQILSKMSPSSMKIALRELQLGKHMSLSECLQMEYRLAVGCLSNKDFYEGVRAALIDKDKNPKWNPATLEEVSDEHIESYFAKLPEQQELKYKL